MRSLEKKPTKMVIVGNITFNYSLKNIPNSPKSQYEMMLVESMESQEVRHYQEAIKDAGHKDEK